MNGKADQMNGKADQSGTLARILSSQVRAEVFRFLYCEIRKLYEEG